MVKLREIVNMSTFPTSKNVFDSAVSQKCQDQCNTKVRVIAFYIDVRAIASAKHISMVHICVDRQSCPEAKVGPIEV